MRFCSFRSADALACDPASETLSAGGKTHVVAETRDAFGRFVGYVYSKNGAAQQTVSASYEAATGRFAGAGFLHGGAQKTFSYAYLAGTSLVQTLTCPNNMTETRSYEAARNLLSGIAYKRGTTLVSQRTYVRDALGRPLTRSTARNGTTQNDAFGYNARSELTSATLGNDEYAYAFDNIGNRNTASETGSALAYSTNNLNQYASIGENEGNAFVPGYDADGNATSIQTSTGTWSVEYNGANRPVRFRNEESDTTIECGYDSQGRRCFKKVTVAGTVTLHHRYIYRGYLQIACVDLTRSGHPALWFVLWDPSQETATRPLAIQKDGTWYTYGCDITKNVCEVFGPAGYIRTSYSYAPFGAVSASGNVTQPFQWSSEHYDSETALVYYNFRHYSPALGRWLSRDPIEEQGGLNLYAFVGNVPTSFVDNQGGFAVAIGGVIGGSFLVPGLIGIGIGAAVVVSVGIVVIGSAIIIDRIIDSLPQTETSLEEEAKTSDDAIPITQCPPCPDRKKRCAPCNPPVDTVMYRHDTTGRPHYVPETGKRELPHYNNYVVYQVPYKEGNPHSCECRYREIDATLVPLAGATPFRRPTGGGVIIM